MMIDVKLSKDQIQLLLDALETQPSTAGTRSLAFKLRDAAKIPAPVREQFSGLGAWANR